MSETVLKQCNKINQANAPVCRYCIEKKHCNDKRNLAPQYSFGVAKQLIFDCIMELHYHTDGLSDEQIADKLHNILHELDKMPVEVNNLL